MGAPTWVVASRTYTTRPTGGGSGLGVDAVPVWAGNIAPSVATGIREGDGYRTNLAVGGPSREEYVALLLRNATGTVLDQVTVLLQPNSYFNPVEGKPRARAELPLEARSRTDGAE